LKKDYLKPLSETVRPDSLIRLREVLEELPPIRIQAKVVPSYNCKFNRVRFTLKIKMLEEEIKKTKKEKK
jgi:hypothetical protein